MQQQIISYEELFTHIKDKGTYLCEDLHTSYWLKWGGGYKRRKTFIEYSQNFIDYLNAFHSQQKSLKVDSFTKSVDSIHYYYTIIVIEKRKVEAPFHEKTGSPSFTNDLKMTTAQKVRFKFSTLTLTIINKTLRFLRLPGFIWK